MFPTSAMSYPATRWRNRNGIKLVLILVHVILVVKRRGGNRGWYVGTLRKFFIVEGLW